MGVTGGKTGETAAAEVGGNCIETRRNNALEERTTHAFLVKSRLARGGNMVEGCASCRGVSSYGGRWGLVVSGRAQSWWVLSRMRFWFWLGRFGGA